MHHGGLPDLATKAWASDDHLGPQTPRCGLVVLSRHSTFFLLYMSSGSIARNILGDQATAGAGGVKEARAGPGPTPGVPLLHLGVTMPCSGDLGASWFTSEPVANSSATPDSGDHDHGFRRNDPDRNLCRTHWRCRRGQARLGGQGGPGRRHHRRLRPGFVIGVILVTVLAIQLGLFPATSTISPDAGADAWIYSMSLPVIALLINGVTGGAQQIRSAVIKQLERDYVRTLRSRGIGEREILFKHVLRSAAPAGLTVLSLQLIGMLGGVVIIEQIFALPGMGPLAVAATGQSRSSGGDGRRDVHGGRRHCREPAGGHSQWLAQPEGTCLMNEFFRRSRRNRGSCRPPREQAKAAPWSVPP